MEIEKLYNTYREQFIAYANKYYSLEESIIIDIYQESFIALYESGQLTSGNLTVSLKTYLFAIGKHKIWNYLRNNEKFVKMPDELKIPETDDWKEQQEIVNKSVEKLKEPCNRILTLFYFHGKSMKEIARMVGSKSEQAVKNKKSKCMEKLKELIKQTYKKEDLI